LTRTATWWRGLVATSGWFVALDHFASRTDSQFGIVVDRVWQREPEFSAEMRLLSERAAAAPQTDLKKRVKRQRRK